MTPTVRLARLDDLGALQTLYTQLSARDPVLAPEVAEAALAVMLAHPGLHLLVAELGGQVVGTATLTLIPNLTRGARPYAVVENVVTLDDHRAQGVGRALMDEVERLALIAGAYKLMLQSGEGRTGAHAFYQRLGYSGTSKLAFERRLHADRQR